MKGTKRFFAAVICITAILAACEQSDYSPLRIQSPIGDAGPGGGTIFFAEGGQFMEVSGELGSHNWHNADAAARNHRGGGFYDWRLPDSGQLTLMYENLHRKGLGGFSNAWYWGALITGDTAWALNFSTGHRASNWSLGVANRVRAVRSFSGDGGTTLTIRNESSHEITDVLWNNVLFSARPGMDSIDPGTSATMNVQPGVGFIRFNSPSSPLNFRTSEPVLVEEGERREFVFLNNTVVVDENNVSDTLNAAVTRRTTLTIRNDSSFAVTHVNWNNVNFTTGTNSLNPGANVTRDVQAGSGFVRIRPRLNPFSLRIDQQVIVTEGQRKELVILNDTAIVKEIDNTEGTLASVAGVQLQIGDTGPGGGTIFFAAGGQFREVSVELGSLTWGAADTAARGHRGGGFNDWRLPNSGDFSLIYENLHREGLGGLADAVYWGNPMNADYVWAFDFANGTLGSYFRFASIINRTRAVRTFSVQ